MCSIMGRMKSGNQGKDTHASLWIAISQVAHMIFPRVFGLMMGRLRSIQMMRLMRPNTRRSRRLIRSTPLARLLRAAAAAGFLTSPAPRTPVLPTLFMLIDPMFLNHMFTLASEPK